MHKNYIKKMHSGFVLWVIVMPMLAGCASLQTKGQGETAIPSTGLSEKIQKHRDGSFSSNRLKSDAYYYFLLAEMKTSERQYKEAVEIYQKAISYDPSSPFLYKSLALAYAMTGKMTEAIQACKDALSFDPDYIEARMILGRFYSNISIKYMAI